MLHFIAQFAGGSKTSRFSVVLRLVCRNFRDLHGLHPEVASA
jgi:hypothetical protein